MIVADNLKLPIFDEETMQKLIDVHERITETHSPQEYYLGSEKSVQFWGDNWPPTDYFQDHIHEFERLGLILIEYWIRDDGRRFSKLESDSECRLKVNMLLEGYLRGHVYLGKIRYLIVNGCII